MFRIAKFACDFIAFRNCCSTASNAQIRADLIGCQHCCHQCGTRTIIFDAAQKTFCCILHKLNCASATFRLFGVLVDPKLNMKGEIQCIRKKASSKIRAILNTKAYCDPMNMYVACWNHLLWLFSCNAIPRGLFEPDTAEVHLGIVLDQS